jgi:hypothetical protein
MPHCSRFGVGQQCEREFCQNIALVLFAFNVGAAAGRYLERSLVAGFERLHLFQDQRQTARPTNRQFL